MKQKTDTFDAVVIAAPIEYANIKLKNIPWKFAPREWMPLDLHVVTADSLNPEYFHLQKSELPDILTTTNDVAEYTTLIPVSTTTKGQLVWQCFVRQGQDFPYKKIFSGVTNHFLRSWDYTYQKLTPLPNTQAFQPWLISENLVYNCAIEQISSGMEYTVASSKNAGRYLAQANARKCSGMLCNFITNHIYNLPI